MSPLADATPGPGSYDPPRTGTNDFCHLHSIQDRRLQTYRTASSDFDLMNLSVFPRPRPMTIGNRGRLQFSPEPEHTPGPAMASTELIVRDRPAPRRPEKARKVSAPDSTPGPGAYNPLVIYPRVKSVMPMERAAPRAGIWTPGEPGPAPGTYDPVRPLVQPKGWTSRLRHIRPPPVIQLSRAKKRAEWDEDADGTE
jgi:hypothetical protein